MRYCQASRLLGVPVETGCTDSAIQRPCFLWDHSFCHQCMPEHNPATMHACKDFVNVQNMMSSYFMSARCGACRRLQLSKCLWIVARIHQLVARALVARWVRGGVPVCRASCHTAGSRSSIPPAPIRKLVSNVIIQWWPRARAVVQPQWASCCYGQRTAGWSCSMHE